MVEIVAEISGNHGGDMSKMRDLIALARLAGCDYAKFQFYRPEDMPDRGEGDNGAMYEKLAVPDDWLPEMFKTASSANIGLFASVFSVRAVETMLKFDAPYIKIASMDSTPLSKQTFLDIVGAVGDRRDIVYSLNHDGTLPHGQRILGYPLVCPPDGRLAGYVPALYYGLSDHSPGIEIPLRFIRRGARMVEKHFKLDDDCIDAAFSAGPDTMRTLCRIAHNR